MDRILIIFTFLLCLFIGTYFFPDGVAAVLIIVLFSIVTIALIRHESPEDAEFLQRLFLIALLLRVGFGMLIQMFDLRSFFGNDATLYDMLGYRLYEIWFEGVSTDSDLSYRALDLGASGWGMNYLVAAIYTVTGKNAFAAQTFCACVGAATAPLVYTCANKIFNNRNVGRTAAVIVAVVPAFVIWSGQLLKDGLMIFLLVLSITMVLSLQEKFSYVSVGLLIFSLFGILSLRFYIFYMVVVAVVGSFIIGSSTSRQSILKRLAAILIIGGSLAYFGALQNAGEKLEEFGNLESIQRSRQDLSTSASGFGEDLDVSTTEGAMVALPIGFSYLMFAPFPWEAGNFRQAIALPEVLVWWTMMPFLVVGLWYSFKYRLRNSIAVLLFTFLLTIGYSLFQGNVGTAYRQRTQIQVFLYMFIGVGWTLRKEKKENEKLLQQQRRQKHLEFLRKSRLETEQKDYEEVRKEDNKKEDSDN
jgi:hypothetical protein